MEQGRFFFYKASPCVMTWDVDVFDAETSPLASPLGPPIVPYLDPFS
jgi:hypothetical protein